MRNIYLLLVIFCVGMTIFYGCRVSDIENEDEVTEFVINNETDTTFVTLRIREMGDSYWKYDKTVAFPGNSEYTVTPTRPYNREARYEIQLESKAKNTATLSNVALTQNSIIYFNLIDFDNPDAASVITKINIMNNTIVNFYFLAIRETGKISWLFEMAGDFVKTEPSTLLPPVDLPQKLDTRKKYDVRLRQQQTGGIEAIKTNLTLKQNGNIIFESSDL